jgi:hypothetical protein
LRFKLPLKSTGGEGEVSPEWRWCPGKDKITDLVSHVITRFHLSDSH